MQFTQQNKNIVLLHQKSPNI